MDMMRKHSLKCLRINADEFSLYSIRNGVSNVIKLCYIKLASCPVLARLQKCLRHWRKTSSWRDILDKVTDLTMGVTCTLKIA